LYVADSEFATHHLVVDQPPPSGDQHTNYKLSGLTATDTAVKTRRQHRTGHISVTSLLIFKITSKTLANKCRPLSTWTALLIEVIVYHSHHKLYIKKRQKVEKLKEIKKSKRTAAATTTTNDFGGSAQSSTAL